MRVCQLALTWQEKYFASRKTSGTCLLMGKPKNESEFDHPLQKGQVHNWIVACVSNPQLSEKLSISIEGVFRIPQSSSTTGTPPSDCLVSYTGHSLEKFYPSAEVQSVYSIATLAKSNHLQLFHFFHWYFIIAEVQTVNSTPPSADWASVVVANMLDCNIVVNEFKLQSSFRTYTLGKDWKPFPHRLWVK